jgi:hypothetical protein
MPCLVPAAIDPPPPLPPILVDTFGGWEEGLKRRVEEQVCALVAFISTSVFHYVFEVSTEYPWHCSAGGGASR